MEGNQRKEETKSRIYTLLKEGMFKKDASVMAGIDESTLYRWIKEDASFASQVEANILEYKMSLIKNLSKHAETNGMLALQILKTRWKEWGYPQYQEGDGEDSIKRLTDTIDAMLAMKDTDESSESHI